MSVTDTDIVEHFPSPSCFFDSHADKTPASCSYPHLTEGETEAQRRSAAEQGGTLSAWPQGQCPLHWARGIWAEALDSGLCVVVLEPRGSSSLAWFWPLAMEGVGKRYFRGRGSQVEDGLVSACKWLACRRGGCSSNSKTNSTQHLPCARPCPNCF